jgi:peroxiredoxin Q/BCP
MAKALKEGDAAPAIQVEDDKGQPFSLASLKGKNVVLYFYPKADTPGCTQANPASFAITRRSSPRPTP